MVRVGLSGALATLIDVLTLIALVELAGVYVTIAAFVAALNGGVTNFLVNKFWAFNDYSRIHFRQISSYAAVSLVTALFVAAAVHLFAIVIGWPYLIAKALAAVTVFAAWSYPAQAKLVFPRAARIPRNAA
jgi:putative flippase GtrA